MIYALMSKRGITTQAGLARRLEGPGNAAVSKDRLSKWMRGMNAPPQWLPRALVVALDLDAAEETELARGFAFGADVKTDARYVAEAV